VSALGLSPGNVFAGGPFSGAGGAFGFEVPPGNPGAIESAGRNWKSVGQRLMTQGESMNNASQIALQADGGWLGTAAGAYSEYSGRLVTALTANAEACERAGDALSALGRALEQAQQVTRQALADCQRLHTEVTTQQGIAGSAAQAAATATAQAAAAPHPAVAHTFASQAADAQRTQTAAAGAAQRAQGELDAAQRRGQHSAEAYGHEARAATGRLLSAAGSIRALPPTAGAAPVPVTVRPGDVSLAAPLLIGGTPTSPLGAPLGSTAMTPGEIEAIIAQERQDTIAGSSAGAAVPEREVAASVLPIAIPLNSSTASGLYFGAVSGYAGYTGAAAKGQAAADQAAIRASYQRWLKLHGVSDNPALPDSVRGAAADEADSLIPGMAARAAARPALRSTINFADHFLGYGIGGVGDAAVHLASGDNVVKSASAGAGSAAGGTIGAWAGGIACSETVIATPLCAGIGGVVGGFLGDVGGSAIGGLLNDL
jgi:hypothetical protein